MIFFVMQTVLFSMKQYDFHQILGGHFLHEQYKICMIRNTFLHAGQIQCTYTTCDFIFSIYIEKP